MFSFHQSYSKGDSCKEISADLLILAPPAAWEISSFSPLLPQTQSSVRFLQNVHRLCRAG